MDPRRRGCCYSGRSNVVEEALGIPQEVVVGHVRIRDLVPHKPWSRSSREALLHLPKELREGLPEPLLHRCVHVILACGLRCLVRVLDVDGVAAEHVNLGLFDLVRPHQADLLGDKPLNRLRLANFDTSALQHRNLSHGCVKLTFRLLGIPLGPHDGAEIARGGHRHWVADILVVHLGGREEEPGRLGNAPDVEVAQLHGHSES
mmetsp:Transcript_28357/g.50680  ORF Transcript_28357/g.50680 Transcript_28357/m.50680 type:complete len:204 (-) Transcript_28357:39-650(-)